jgi:uncharacterized OB-fold protein
MGFEKFGTVSFTSESKVADFVTFLEQGKVMAVRCKKCGMRHFPPRSDCSNCLSCELEWFEIAGEGKLLTYSTVAYGPTGFEEDCPYTLALVSFEGGLQVFGRLARDIEASQTRVGMEVKVAPVALKGGRISYEFRPA